MNCRPANPVNVVLFIYIYIYIYIFIYEQNHVNKICHLANVAEANFRERWGYINNNQFEYGLSPGQSGQPGCIYIYIYIYIY